MTSTMNRARMGILASAIVAPLVLGGMGRAFSAGNLTEANKTMNLYSEIIFFETAGALAEFKSSNFAFSAQASAVALKSGASANAKYRDGVAVFTATKAGLMLEASVGGQKFGHKPFPAKS
jgi:hypothetical protein